MKKIEEWQIWRTVTIGKYKNSTEIIKALESNGIRISNDTQYLLGKMEINSKKQSILLTKVMIRDLGFTENPTTEQLFKKAHEHGLELCPAEVAPILRLEYSDQPIYRWIDVAMETITDKNGSPCVFALRHISDGLWLHSSWAIPGNKWDLGDEIVFRIRNSSQTLDPVDLDPSDTLNLSLNEIEINGVTYVRKENHE